MNHCGDWYPEGVAKNCSFHLLCCCWCVAFRWCTPLFCKKRLHPWLLQLPLIGIILIVFLWIKYAFYSLCMWASEYKFSNEDTLGRPSTPLPLIRRTSPNYYGPWIIEWRYDCSRTMLNPSKSHFRQIEKLIIRKPLVRLISWTGTMAKVRTRTRYIVPTISPIIIIDIILCPGSADVNTLF